MNREQLRETLEQAGVPQRWYTIDAERNESTCLILEGATWKVFYSEKGQRNDEVSFHTEGEACLYIYEAMIHDLGHIR